MAISLASLRRSGAAMPPRLLTYGVAGVGSDSATWTMDVTPFSITTLTSANQSPRSIVVQTLDVTFSEAIDPTTFTRSDVRITRDGGAENLLVGFSIPEEQRLFITHVTGNTFRLNNINWVVGQDGLYQVTVDATGILDRAGNAGLGSSSTSWVMDIGTPSGATNRSSARSSDAITVSPRIAGRVILQYQPLSAPLSPSSIRNTLYQ